MCSRCSILLVSSRRKKVLEDYLDREIELETTFRQQGDNGKLEKIPPPEADFFFVRQKEMLGTGQALLLTRPFVGEEPFVVAYPDDLHMGKVPLARQLAIFRQAYAQVSGLARTVRGPVMSATPGKVHINGVAQIGGEKVFVLSFLQARDPEWVGRPFFAAFDPEATWLFDLQPAAQVFQFLGHHAPVTADNLVFLEGIHTFAQGIDLFDPIVDLVGSCQNAGSHHAGVFLGRLAD